MLSGKCAVVTGSTSGIGLGIAHALGAEGCRVVLNGLAGPAAVDALREEFSERHGAEAAFHGADLRDPDQIGDLIAHAGREFGGVDILVNNAGVQHTALVEAFPAEKWNDIIAVNLSAAFHAIRLAVPGMREKNWGASSTPPRCMAWWPPPRRRPMSRPSTASSA